MAYVIIVIVLGGLNESSECWNGYFEFLDEPQLNKHELQQARHFILFPQPTIKRRILQVVSSFLSKRVLISLLRKVLDFL